MAVSSFSLSVTNRGREFQIGGSGILDLTAVAALRQAIEDSCGTEGASVIIDLLAVTDLRPDAVAALVEAGDFCRAKGIAFTMTAGDAFLQVLSQAGYNAELLPL